MVFDVRSPQGGGRLAVRPPLQGYGAPLEALNAEFGLPSESGAPISIRAGLWAWRVSPVDSLESSYENS